MNFTQLVTPQRLNVLVKRQSSKILLPNLPVFRKVRLGTGLRTAEDFRAALKKVWAEVGQWGNGCLEKPGFTVASQEIEVDLLNVSLWNLGFKSGAHLHSILMKGIDLGLHLCPAETGPQLRLQYLDQPKGEWLSVAMEPITDSVGYPHIFDVGHDAKGLWLSGMDGEPDRWYKPEDRFLWVRE